MIGTFKSATATVCSPDALPGIRLLVVSSAATPTPVYVLDDYLLNINNDD